MHKILTTSLLSDLIISVSRKDGKGKKKRKKRNKGEKEGKKTMVDKKGNFEVKYCYYAINILESFFKFGKEKDL